MDIEKILDAIYEKADYGMNYKRTRGLPGKQVHERGKRIRLGEGVIVRHYKKDNGEAFYEIFERHSPVFQLIHHEGRYFVRKPRPGKWIAQLGLEESDVFGQQRTELEERGGLIIKKAWHLARRGAHFDMAEEEMRSIGRLYRQDGLLIRLMRFEHNGESSPTFLDIEIGGSFVFSAEMYNKKQYIRYNGVPYWTENFLRTK